MLVLDAELQNLISPITSKLYADNESHDQEQAPLFSPDESEL